jgi:Fe-S-cluster containining protein
MKHSKKIKRLNLLPNHTLDDKFEIEHHKAFKKIDCFSCANCCKTKGPAFTKKDINRIARHMEITPPEFSDTYLEMNQDDAYVLKTTPCLFLQENNKCSIYEIRPKACASYPHTNTRNVKNLLPYFKAHLTTCPIIEEIIQEI